MNHYVDILLKPDSDMRESQLMNLVYNKFHRILAKIDAKQIGASFPFYQIKLGQTLRLHGCKTDLNNLMIEDWLGSIAGYCKISDVKATPIDAKYRTISRIRTNMNKSKLARLKQRGSITPDSEKAYKAKMHSQYLSAPYFDLESGSTGQRYRRFIHFGPLLDKPMIGNFDSYGLSATATIPWF